MLQSVLPAYDGPTTVVPAPTSAERLEERDGIEAKSVVLKQLSDALDIIGAHAPERIATIGGDCGVSMAPFSALISRSSLLIHYGKTAPRSWNAFEEPVFRGSRFIST